MDEVTAAYIAGIIDGEGSISVTMSHAKRTYSYAYPLVRVANTDRRLIDWLAEHVPMKASRQYRSAMNERCKDVHHIGWAVGQATALLRAVRPYLVLKREQADIAVALEDARLRAEQEAGGKLGRSRRVPAWLIQHRHSAYSRMLELNRRGSGASASYT